MISLTLARARFNTAVEEGSGGCTVANVEKIVGHCDDACCAPSPLVLPSKPLLDRRPLIREAFRLEWLTIGWMVIEAVVAIGSGIVSGSLVLFAFGLDRVMSSFGGRPRVAIVGRASPRTQVLEDAERIAGRVGGALLFTLAGYVVVAASWNLWTRPHETFSWPGFIVTLWRFRSCDICNAET